MFELFFSQNWTSAPGRMCMSQTCKQLHHKAAWSKWPAILYFGLTSRCSINRASWFQIVRREMPSKFFLVIISCMQIGIVYMPTSSTWVQYGFIFLSKEGMFEIFTSEKLNHYTAKLHNQNYRPLLYIGAEMTTNYTIFTSFKFKDMRNTWQTT